MKITINGKECGVFACGKKATAGPERLDYEDIVHMAGKSSGATVTYRRINGCQGDLCPGQSVDLCDGMAFYCAHTDNA
jgi:hypothetical protein